MRLTRFLFPTLLVGLVWAVGGAGALRSLAQPEETPPKIITLLENGPEPPLPPPVKEEVPNPFLEPDLAERRTPPRPRRPNEINLEKVRILPLRDEVQAVVREAKGLEAAGLRLAVVGDHLVIGGPAAMVDALMQVLTGIDPTLAPPRVTVQARVYLGSMEALPLPPPADDPLLPRLREQFGFPHLTLLAAPVWQGVDSEPINAKMGGVRAEEQKTNLKLGFSILPQIWTPDQVFLKLNLTGHWQALLPGASADYALETTLRGAPGETLLLAAPDDVTQSALIYALTVGTNGEMIVAPGK